MLETVKSTISNLEDVPFSTYFMSYVQAVQDDNLTNELHYVLHHNPIDIRLINNLLNHTYEGLILDND